MILIALGANLSSPAGTPSQTFRAALDVLARAHVVPDVVSSFYRTPAWPDPRDPAFVNAVARVQTDLPPEELLTLLKQTETMFGRTAGARNAPRTLDLDILDYEGRIEDGPPTLPHPRIAARAFVLLPLREIAPQWRDPRSGKTIGEMIAALPQQDSDAITRLDGAVHG